MKRIILLIVGMLLSWLLVGCGGSSFYQWSADKVVTMLQQNGLEAQDPRAAIEADYLGGPQTAKEAQAFSIPSAGEGEGGLVLSFDDEDKFEEAKTYYEELAETPGNPRVFARDNIVLLISGKLSQAEANPYDSVLAKLKFVR